MTESQISPRPDPASPTGPAETPLIRMLGPLELGNPQGARVTPLRRKQRELLGLLLIRAGAVVSADEIVDTLWGERPPPSARANLYSHLCSLRRLLAWVAPGAGVRPARVRHGYRLGLGPDECDSAVFERLVGRGHSALAANQPASAVDHLTRAIALWRGPVLAGLDGDWLSPTAARLEEMYLGAIEDRVQARLVMGRYTGLCVELAAATVRYPLRERLWSQLITVLHRTGRSAEAQFAYARLHDLLDRELGVRPSPAVRHLYRQIVADANR